MQRLLIARLILRDPKVVLLDEPFSAIDNDALPLLMQVILDFIADGKTVIAVSHDQNQIRTYFPQTLLLSGCVVYWGDTATALNPENLSKARDLALKGF
ncbi:Zinc ABC transporter, ATP-binding protein ZnuC [Taylorella asinigenitalis MCE3]|uniref:Zinc ABC transporter, ATP-binding protein ZnuC n=2 Tax=Taylorella asinigenitalis TaxID=84590 RepID=G4QDE3_TAYAM|nr:Zinc ABC transporter, ATP-binding protein ZnuC [Taylorella asinigenitalis MCE3]